MKSIALSNNAKCVLSDQVLDCVSIERDLGIFIQDNLKVAERCSLLSP